MDVRRLRAVAEARLREAEEAYGHPVLPSRRHRPSHAIRSGQGIVLHHPPRRRTANVWTLDGSRAIPRFICRPRTTSRVPGRVNHAVLPLALWWTNGLGQRDVAMWEIMRRMRGESARKELHAPRHRLLHNSMAAAWWNYRDNLEEMHLVSHVPRPGEFHLLGARMFAWALSMRRSTQ